MAGFWSGIFKQVSSKKLEKLENTGEKIIGRLNKIGSAEAFDKADAIRDSIGKIGAGPDYVKNLAKAVSSGKSFANGARREAVGKWMGAVLTSRPGKILGAMVAIPALAVAAVAAVAAFAGKRESKEMESREKLMAQQNVAANAELVALRQQVLGGGNTMMGMEPVHGAHAEQVVARRGGASQGVDTSIPNMTAFDQSSIQNVRQV
jgi:hypothetical protein